VSSLDENLLRSEVLRYYHELCRQNPGDGQWTPHATMDIAQRFGDAGHDVVPTETDIARAVVYLAEKLLLRVTRTQGYISGEPTALRAEITGHGIDVFEEPQRFGEELPPAVIQYIIHGDANVVHGNQASGGIVHGDQQNVGRDNIGTMAQGHATMVKFPAHELRELLSGQSEAVEAVEALDTELQQANPRASRVLAAIETLKAVADLGEAGKVFAGWLTDPAVQHHLAMMAASVFH